MQAGGANKSRSGTVAEAAEGDEVLCVDLLNSQGCRGQQTNNGVSGW